MGQGGVSRSRGGGGYHVIGGQASVGWNRTSDDDDFGVFILGKDYVAGTVGGGISFHVKGLDVEGWHRGWAIRSFDEVRVSMADVSFLATQIGQPAMGIVKMTDAKQSRYRFEFCNLKGTYSQANLASISGGFSNFSMWEEGWNCEASTVNGVAKSGTAWMNALAEQSGLTGGCSWRARPNGNTILALEGGQLRSETAGLGLSYDRGASYHPMAVKDDLQRFTAKQEFSEGLSLRSPDGSPWRITVDDEGRVAEATDVLLKDSRWPPRWIVERGCARERND